MRYLLLSIALGGFVPAKAQRDTTVLIYAATITEADLKEYLTVLASDEFEGRETGFAGQKKAAAYLSEKFRGFGIGPVPGAKDKGLINGYEQQFELQLKRPGGIGVQVAGRNFTFMKDYFYFGESLKREGTVDHIILLGRDKDPQGANMKGAAVMLFVEPMKNTGGATPGPEWMRMVAPRVNAAKLGGAQVVVVSTPDAAALMSSMHHHLTAPRMRLKEGAGKGGQTGAQEAQVLFVTPEMSSSILAAGGMSLRKAKRIKRPDTITTDVRFSVEDRDSTVTGENVLAYIEGSDKKDELVVVTAHYDHIGVANGEVYNGADDDGSGTVALLEMAEAFSKAKKEGHGPRRSILFMPVSGEEKGLLGSHYYSEHPVFPLERTVADLNIDMIGRTDSAHAGGEPYVYVIGSDRLSTALHAINEDANEEYVGLQLDYSFNAPDDPNRFYFRSDHYNFARKGVPVIFYFSGVHEDYHGPGDEVQKIRFDLLRERTLLVFHTAWELANREERIAVDRPLEGE